MLCSMDVNLKELLEASIHLLPRKKNLKIEESTMAQSASCYCKVIECNKSGIKTNPEQAVVVQAYLIGSRATDYTGADLTGEL